MCVPRVSPSSSLPLPEPVPACARLFPQHYAATTSGNDFMWVAGGDANSNGTYQYSWSNNTWTNLGPLPWWSTNLTATDLAWAGGNLFLFGGAVAGVPSNILWVKRYARAVCVRARVCVRGRRPPPLVCGVLLCCILTCARMAGLLPSPLRALFLQAHSHDPFPS